MTTEYPVASTLACVLVLLGTIFTLFHLENQFKLQVWLKHSPKKIILFPAGLFVVYTFYTLRTGGFELASGARMFAYLCIPVALVIFLQINRLTHPVWCVLIFLSVVLPQDWGWIGTRQHAMPHALDWYIRALSGIVLALVIGCGLDVLPKMKLGYKFSKIDVQWTVGLLLILLVLAGVVGVGSGFLILRPFLHQPTVVEVFWQVITHLFSVRFFVTFLVYTISIALFEEIWFRGVLQPTLSSWFRNETHGYLVTSVLFGAYHLNNHAAGVYPTQWNWKYAGMATIAGLVYGYAFKRTSRLWCSNFVHGATDAIWHLFAL